MNIRPFSWHDLWILYRYRNQAQFFDNALAVTRGTLLGWDSVFGDFNPTYASYTGVLRTRTDGPLVGHVSYRLGEHSARLAFLLPDRSLSSPAAIHLAEDLAWIAGDRGALHLLAEVEERCDAVETLRRAGFSIYGWQRIYQFSQERLPGECQERCWYAAQVEDEIPVKSLYHTLAPPLVQGAEPINGRARGGLVYRQDGEVLAYAEGRFGPRGVYLNPLVHPDVKEPVTVMHSLLNSLSLNGRRPVYMAVRSYQSWLEPALEDLGGETSPRQALMVKHMVQMQRAMQPAARPAVLDNRQPALASPNVENASLAVEPQSPEPPYKPVF